MCYGPNTYPETLWMLPISCLARTPDTTWSTWLIQQLFPNLLLLNVSMTVGDIAALPLDAESWTSPLVPLAPHLLPLLVSFPLPGSSLISLLDSRALVSGPPSCLIHHAVINGNLGNKFSLFKVSETPVFLFSSIPMHRLSSYIEHLQFFADTWLPSTLWPAAHMAPSTWSSMCLLCSLSPRGLSRDIIFFQELSLGS